MPRNNGYSASEIMAMQQDAAERVREMQRRARQRMEQGGRPPAAPAAPSRPAVPQSGPPQAGLLQGLLGDSDRLLLLLLILVLSQEETDPALMMALFWLML